MAIVAYSPSSITSCSAKDHEDDQLEFNVMVLESTENLKNS